MTWFKVDDGLHTHPKAIAAGTAALGLWVRCGSYSAQHLTEGFIPAAVVSIYGTKSMAQALVRSGLFVEVDAGYQMHDFLDRNPTREDVEKDRAAAAERQKRARERARESRRDSRVSHGVSHGDVTPVVTVPPTRPDPTRKSKTPSVSSSRRAAPAPDIFPITDAMKEWGAAHCPHVFDPRAQTDQFLDHHRAKGSLFKDWTAAWRTWMTNAERFAVRDGLKIPAEYDPHKEHLRGTS